MLLAKNKLLSLLFLIVSLVYVAQTVLDKPDPATLTKYHITADRVHFLGLMIALPYILIWFASFIGYLRLKTYTRIIAGSKDGRAFKTITSGVLLLGVWLPLSTIIGNLASNHYIFHPGSAPALVRLINYANLLILFPAFLLVYLGSKKLLTLLKGKQAILAQTHIFTLSYISFSALYVLLVLHDPSRQLPAGDVRFGTYYEPDWLIVTTIVIPRLIIWYLGLQTMRNLYIYRSRVNGNLYRAALKRLAQGIAGVVVATIVLRIFQSVSATTSHLSLGALLVVVYILLAIMSVGYILIAKGSKSLQKLEEI